MFVVGCFGVVVGEFLMLKQEMSQRNGFMSEVVPSLSQKQIELELNWNRI